jgi:hypothetical protein
MTGMRYRSPGAAIDVRAGGPWEKGTGSSGYLMGSKQARPIRVVFVAKFGVSAPLHPERFTGGKAVPKMGGPPRVFDDLRERVNSTDIALRLGGN